MSTGGGKIASRKLWLVISGQALWTLLLVGGYIESGDFVQLSTGCFIAYVIGNGAEHFASR